MKSIVWEERLNRVTAIFLPSGSTQNGVNEAGSNSFLECPANLFHISTAKSDTETHSMLYSLKIESIKGL